MTSSFGSEPESISPESEASGRPFEVLVDDNIHLMDKDERWRLGAFATLDEARQACMALVEECLSDHYQPGMGAEEIYGQHVMFGDDPFILSPGEPGKFSAGNYAKPVQLKFAPQTTGSLIRCPGKSLGEAQWVSHRGLMLLPDLI